MTSYVTSLEKECPNPPTQRYLEKENPVRKITTNLNHPRLLRKKKERKEKKERRKEKERKKNL